MQVQEANVVLTTGTPTGAKRYSDGKQCWRNTSVDGHAKSRRLRLWAERTYLLDDDILLRFNNRVTLS